MNVTGTLMFDVEVDTDEVRLKEISGAIIAAISRIPGVVRVEEVDSDLTESDESE